MTNAPRIEFGKYAGWLITDVPDTYLEFMIKIYEKNVATYKAELADRQARMDANMSLAERMVTAGYRALAREMHPDYGGTNDDMVELNKVVAALRARL